MCWAQAFSPVGSRQALSEYIEMLPHNKILAFGGDLGGGNAWGVYANAKLARMNVANVLSEKITAGLMTEVEAVKLAYKLFYENACQLYNLKDI